MLFILLISFCVLDDIIILFLQNRHPVTHWHTDFSATVSWTAGEHPSPWGAMGHVSLSCDCKVSNVGLDDYRPFNS